MDKNTARSLKIKTATLKRYTNSNKNIYFRNQKDYLSYSKENKELEAKLEQIKEAGDETAIKKLNE